MVFSINWSVGAGGASPCGIEKKEQELEPDALLVILLKVMLDC
jgi:hypothetical protein